MGLSTLAGQQLLKMHSHYKMLAGLFSPFFLLPGIPSTAAIVLVAVRHRRGKGFTVILTCGLIDGQMFAINRAEQCNKSESFAIIKSLIKAARVREMQFFFLRFIFTRVG